MHESESAESSVAAGAFLLTHRGRGTARSGVEGAAVARLPAHAKSGSELSFSVRTRVQTIRRAGRGEPPPPDFVWSPSPDG